ncbi:hypothetical protein AB0395_34815 [Streptosporangium sp. NPDC051023]|uniref:hypothetical protein n=1 Tax=Streptosporangium sp. NPDC051023 TaxID=3155410 RepID=UPI00344DF89D
MTTTPQAQALTGILLALEIPQEGFRIRTERIPRSWVNPNTNQREAWIEHGDAHASFRGKEARALAVANTQALVGQELTVTIWRGNCGHDSGDLMVSTCRNPRKTVTYALALDYCHTCGAQGGDVS